MDHDGFSFIECLSECVEFYEGAFDASNPRKGGVFNTVPASHDVTDEMAAYKLANEDFPGSFGIFYKVNRPTKERQRGRGPALAPRQGEGTQGLADPPEVVRSAEVNAAKYLQAPVHAGAFFVPELFRRAGAPSE